MFDITKNTLVKILVLALVIYVFGYFGNTFLFTGGVFNYPGITFIFLAILSILLVFGINFSFNRITTPLTKTQLFASSLKYVLIVILIYFAINIFWRFMQSNEYPLSDYSANAVMFFVILFIIGFVEWIAFLINSLSSTLLGEKAKTQLKDVMEKSIFCSKCGDKLSKENKFCHECGEKVK